MYKTDEIKRINLEISVKFGKIEVHIAHAKSIAGLFETLFAGHREGICRSLCLADAGGGRKYRSRY